MDSTGLGSEVITGIAFDTLFNVYGVTYTTLYKQAPGSTTWVKNSTFPTQPGSGLAGVFVDRKDRIFVGTGSNGVYRSFDNGASWQPDTTGMGKVQILKFTDDPHGNVYAANGYLYFSASGTQPWRRIDSALQTLVGPNIGVGDVVVDTSIEVATSAGVFQSKDTGKTWTDNSRGLKAENVVGLVRTAKGRLLVGGPRGIYYRNAGDTVWNKTYPPVGYLGYLPLQMDNLGNIYTLDGSYSSNQPNVYKSVDSGLTWQIDTAGFGTLPFEYFEFYVDEAGEQHCFAQPGTFNDELPYKHLLGGTWTVDTAGMHLPNTGIYHSSFVSDGAGTMFASYSNGTIYRRAVGGTVWSVDSTFTGGSNMWRGKNGDIYGSNRDGFFRRHAGVWSNMTLPAGIPAGAVPSAVSVDGNGVLLAAFRTSFPLTFKGVYFSSNDGANWTYLALDSMRINTLASYGDTTWAVTLQQGVFKLIPSAATDVKERTVVPSSFELSQNYPNPFNPSTAIEFSLPTRSHVVIEVYNILGQPIRELVNGNKPAGAYRITWDGKDRSGKSVSTGIYLYRLETDNHVETKKMVLLK